jgi:hypothetical protein
MQGMIPYSYPATGQDLKIGKTRFEGNVSDQTFQTHTAYIDIILSLLCVSEDVNTAICGKEKEDCANLARSE